MKSDDKPVQTLHSPDVVAATRRLDVLVRRSVLGIAFAMALFLPVPWLLGSGNPSYIAATLLFILLALLFAHAEASEDRPLVLGLFGFSLLVQQVAHLVLFRLGKAAGGPFLGPDSERYFDLSHRLPELAYSGGPHPASIVGSYDVAHLYIFGGAIELLNADLFCLQTINGGFIALVAALTFSWTRTVLPHYAPALGTLVAAFPSLVVLASLNLFKDPSVTFFLTLGIWALFKLPGATAWIQRMLFALVGGVGLSYVHMARFYLLTHLELAFLCVSLIALLQSSGVKSGERRPMGWRLLTEPRTVLGVLLVFALAEIGPWLVGWPWSPTFYLQTVHYALETPAISEYAPGLAEELATPAAPARTAQPLRGAEDSPMMPPLLPANSTTVRQEPREQAPAAGRSPPAANAGTQDKEEGIVASRPTPQLDGGAQGDRDLRKEEESSTPGLVLPRRLVTGPSGAVFTAVANFLRRFFGPFVWIMPEEWTVGWLLKSDSLFYPGMLIWYLLWPLIAVGLLLCAWRLLRGDGLPFRVAVVTVYCLLSLTQYLVLNLSYRQRDTMFPLLVMFAVFGLSALRKHRPVRYLYGAYWLLLAAVAVVHLLLREALTG